MLKKSIRIILLVFWLVSQLTGTHATQAIASDPDYLPVVKAGTILSYAYLPLITNSPSTWQCYPYGGSGCPYYLSDIAMVSASEGWVVGVQGIILHYTNGILKSVTSPTGTNLHSVAMTSASEGWAVGEDGVILQFLNGTWLGVNSPTYLPLYSVEMVSASEGWAVGGDYQGASYQEPFV